MAVRRARLLARLDGGDQASVSNGERHRRGPGWGSRDGVVLSGWADTRRRGYIAGYGFRLPRVFQDGGRVRQGQISGGTPEDDRPRLSLPKSNIALGIHRRP